MERLVNANYLEEEYTHSIYESDEQSYDIYSENITGGEIIYLIEVKDTRKKLNDAILERQTLSYKNTTPEKTKFISNFFPQWIHGDETPLTISPFLYTDTFNNPNIDKQFNIISIAQAIYKNAKPLEGEVMNILNKTYKRLFSKEPTRL